MNENPSVLIVDDNPINIQVVANLLKTQNYNIAYATSGSQALINLQNNSFDLILLDVMMPDLDGYQTCQKIKQLPGCEKIPVIFLTAKNDQESLLKAFEFGGQDYVAKPFNKSELLSRIKTHLKLKAFEDSLQQQVDAAVTELTKLNHEIEETQREVVCTMGAIAETHSKENGQHVKRVAEYSRLLAVLSGIPIHETELIKMASPMHDIGKVGIPGSILDKPGPLSEAEREIVKSHATLGHEMLKHSRRQLMQTAAIIALEHHERWDGKGYPNGKKGEEIHLYGRITALADVYDALSSKRCYKQVWEDDDIHAYLKSQAGSQFDPDLVSVFFENLHKFQQIREKFADADKTLQQITV